MISQRQIKIGGIAIILLAILNIGLITYISMSKKKPLGPPRPQEMREKDRNARAFIIRELSFSEDQVTAFDSLRIEHRQLAKNINRENRRIRKQYLEQLMENVPSGDTEHLAEAIGENQIILDKALYKHFENIRNLCDANQREKFDGMIREIFKMIMPPPHQGPGRRLGPPPPRR